MFAHNHFMSYSFEIMTFSIPTKIQGGGQNLENAKFFEGPRGVVLSTQGVQYMPKITLSLMVFPVNDIFYFCQNSRWWLKFRKV